MLPIVILIAGTVSMVLGVIVIIGSDSQRGKIYFISFCLANFVWAICNFFTYRVESILLAKLSYSFGTLLPFLLYLWTRKLNLNEIAKFYLVFLMYLLCFCFIFLSIFTDLIIYDVQYIKGGSFIEKEGVLFSYYTGYFIVLYFMALFNLYEHYLQSKFDFLQSKQAKTILAGFLIYGALSVIAGLILPALGFKSYNGIEVAASLIFVGFVTYAIVNYRWMNIKVVTVEILTLLMISKSFTEIFFSKNAFERFYRIIAFLVLSTLAYYP